MHDIAADGIAAAACCSREFGSAADDVAAYDVAAAAADDLVLLDVGLVLLPTTWTLLQRFSATRAHARLVLHIRMPYPAHAGTAEHVVVDAHVAAMR